MPLAPVQKSCSSHHSLPLTFSVFRSASSLSFQQNKNSRFDAADQRAFSESRPAAVTFASGGVSQYGLMLCLNREIWSSSSGHEMKLPCEHKGSVKTTVASQISTGCVNCGETSVCAAFMCAHCERATVDDLRRDTLRRHKLLGRNTMRRDKLQ